MYVTVVLCLEAIFFVMTFPHLMILAILCLSALRDKLEYFAEQKLERVIVPFAVDFAQQEAVSALMKLKVRFQWITHDNEFMFFNIY